MSDKDIIEAQLKTIKAQERHIADLRSIARTLETQLEKATKERRLNTK